MTGNLTPKQDKFVQEYLIDLNATQAAIRAGYSEKTAYRASRNENLSKPEMSRSLPQSTAGSSKTVAEKLGHYSRTGADRIRTPRLPRHP